MIAKKQKASIILFFASWITYTIICFTKTNYTALIASIVKAGVFTKSDSGIISAAFYITFGISQFVGGKFTDRYPMKAITIGIIGSIIPNILLCFTQDFIWVTVLWSICGLMQFGTYPGVVKIISKYLLPEHRAKARTYIVLCIGVGGILSYLTVAPVYEWLGWSGVFGMDAITLTLSLLLWIYALTKLKVLKEDETILSTEEQSKEENVTIQEEKKVSFVSLLFRSGLIIVLFLNLCVTMLSNGFKSWISTMMMENYDLSPTWASMQTAIIYIANILGTFVVVWAFRKMKNEFMTKGVGLLICIPFYAMILFIGKVPEWSILICSIVTTTILYAMGRVNVRIASQFERYGYSATVVSMLNAMASFGVVIANGGFGIIADNFGWQAVTLVLLSACTLSAIAYLLTSIIWKKFKEKEHIENID